MQHYGVPYALTLDGVLVDPATAVKRDRGYRCLVCGDFVHLRSGKIRAAYFAHYPNGESTCSTESVEHQAAKHHLASLLRGGTRSFLLGLPCIGFEDSEEKHHPCHKRIQTPLAVPAFDDVSVEVPFGPYVLDAAATRDGQVVFGMEVYFSHEVDEGKHEYLMLSGLPWFEAGSGTVLANDVPLRALRSVFGDAQCESCRSGAERHARERASREAAEQRRVALAARKSGLEALLARVTPVARNVNRVVLAEHARSGEAFTCFGCGGSVVVDRVEGELVFLHSGVEACDSQLVWVRAGMLAVYHQLKLRPSEVRVLQPCGSFSWLGTACGNTMSWDLPAFDDVDGREPSLVLTARAEPVLQVAFTPNASPVGAPHAMVLNPKASVRKPAECWLPRSGQTCADCTRRNEQEAAKLRKLLGPGGRR